MRKSKRRSRKRKSRKRVSPFRAQRPALSRTQSKRRTRKRAPSARKRRLSYKVSGRGSQYPHTITDFLANTWSIPVDRRSLIGPSLPTRKSWISPEQRTNYFTAYTRPILRHCTPYEAPDFLVSRGSVLSQAAANLLESIGYHNGMSPNENFQNLLNNYGRDGRVGVENLEQILSSEWGTKYLIKAIYMGDMESEGNLIRFLLNLKKGGDFLINVSQSVTRVTGFPGDHITPLYMALRNADYRKLIIRLLLERGANPNNEIKLNDERVTVLSLAITNTLVEIVKLLLDYGADPNKSVYVPSNLPDYHRNRWYSPLFLSLREISNECYEPEIFRGPRYCGDAELIYNILRKTEYDAQLSGVNDKDIFKFPIVNKDNYKYLFHFYSKQEFLI